MVEVAVRQGKAVRQVFFFFFEGGEEGALSIAPLLSSCGNVEELCVSVVVR